MEVHYESATFDLDYSTIRNNRIYGCCPYDSGKRVIREVTQ